MRLPSGDQVAEISRAAGVRLRLRISPFFAGTLNSSPRAPNTARSPCGERSNDSICGATFFQAGSACG